MSFEFKAQSIVRINPLSFKEENGTLTGLDVNVEVNYGELGMNHTIDLWPHFTNAQKTELQALYDTIDYILDDIILE